MVPTPAPRLPAGSRATRSFPVVHVDEVPVFDPRTWELRVVGLVDRPLRLTWEDFRALPRAARESDFHCVVGFSRLDNRWEGVPLRDLIGRARPKAASQFVRLADDRLYDAAVPLERALAEGALLADTHDGRAISPEHGAPVRAIVPGLYATYSVKWIRTIELLESDRPGFWEQRGQPVRIPVP